MKEYIRIHIYIKDKQLADKIEEVARDNRWSISETCDHLIRLGYSRYSVIKRNVSK